MNQILKNAIIYSIGNYSSKIIAILIFPVIVTYLGLEETGKFDLIVSTITTLTIIFSLNIADAIYRWFNTKSDHDKKLSFSNGIVILLLMVMITTLAYILIYYLYPFPYSLKLLSVSYLILVSQIILLFFLQLSRGVGNVTLYTITGILKSLLFTVASLLVVIYTDNKLYNMLIVLLITNVTCIFILIVGIKFKNYFSTKDVSLPNIRLLVTYSIPLILNALSWISLFTINKYIILSELGLNANGVFAVAEKLATGIFFIGMFYYFSVQDYCLSSKYLEGEKSFFNKIIIKVFLILIIAIAILIASAWIIIPTYFPDLEVSLKYLPLLAFANLFTILASYFGIPYNYKKETLYMALTTFIGVSISILLSMLLISSTGIYGVCLSIIFGAAFVFIVRLRYTHIFFNNSTLNKV